MIAILQSSMHGRLAASALNGGSGDAYLVDEELRDAHNHRVPHDEVPAGERARLHVPD